MDEPYEPSSEFLKAVIADEVPLSGSEHAEANLQKLISMLEDGDDRNRDWAALLLSQTDYDTPDVREALVRAASDTNPCVRAEAILGIAQRDPQLALSYVSNALDEDEVTLPIFEAAGMLADTSLVEKLRRYAEPSNDSYLDDYVTEALTACENGTAPEWLRSHLDETS